ncbi:MAG: RNA-binding S4 domain-containing protein [Opitutaceae bacterium]
MPLSNSDAPREVVVAQMPIDLCQFLKFGGLAQSGGEAKRAVSQGLVRLNGEVETRRSRKLAPGDQVMFSGRTIVVRV